MSDNPAIVVVGEGLLGGLVGALLSATGVASRIVRSPEADPRTWDRQALAATLMADGPIAAVLVDVFAAEVCADAPFASMDAASWDRRAQRPIRAALSLAQAAHAALAGPGGPTRAIVVVCPSTGLTGAAGLVHLATASESVRLLAKSAARRWGADGIAVNIVAPSIDACRAVAGTTAAPPVNAAAFADIDPVRDLASLLAYLTSPTVASLAGATIGIDGGALMAP